MVGYTERNLSQGLLNNILNNCAIKLQFDTNVSINKNKTNIC